MRTVLLALSDGDWKVTGNQMQWISDRDPTIALECTDQEFSGSR